jgi:outer membrane protein OmpA-like peptidoglycan-associated protein
MKVISCTTTSLSAILLAASLGMSATAQTSSAPATPPQASSTATDSSTYATGKPLAPASNEGFWGHLNPFARKKWVNRQVQPVKDRLNELDQLTAKNASDIKDVDARAQAGIHQAQSTADQASQQAATATTQAGQAQQTAQMASSHTAQLGTTVANLDQYSQVTDTELRFRSTQTTLNDKAKAALDQIAQQLAGQKGYIVEIQGYSPVRGQVGIAKSQSMADAVTRYLVIDHQVPVYRIYRVGMGDAPLNSTDSAADTTGTSKRDTVVHVSLMHNSLAALNTPANGGSPTGATQ